MRRLTMQAGMHRAVVLGALAWLGAAAPAGAEPTPRPGQCEADTNDYKRDVTTGWAWSTLWYCGNRVGALMFEDAGDQTRVASMHTPQSWFVCYRHGARQRNGSDVWYYTLGDAAEAPFVRRAPWGFMASADVDAAVHPWPGIPLCPPSPFPVVVRRKAP